ncbi:MAG: copper homeostasis periplasmic binding protein CopC, partial [Bradyrhizobium sp.]|nr:copper homeostasis periplasmic binding protein CopC [Bradyrhizobium sp.]
NIIRGLTTAVAAMAIGVGRPRQSANNVAIPGTREGDEMSRNMIAMAVLAVLTMGALATSAGAHPKLTSVSPVADVSSKVAPREIKLNFSEGVIAKLSGLELKEEAGNTIATGTPLNDPRNRKLLIVPLAAPLTAGRYKVSWQAGSEDTHRVKGGYSFEVAR